MASVVFTLASTEILGHTGYIISFLILAIFIALGVVFDMIGLAVATALEAPFHSMAVHRERGAAESLRLIKNADKVTSFCNDVIGDVTGIVSGTTAALIAARLMDGLSAENLIVPLLISGAVTGLTVGGKAVGKSLAFAKNTTIVLGIGKILHIFQFRKNTK